MDQVTPFWEKPLDKLDRAEWEALCDGCGKCCLHKAEDEDSGRIYPTNVACRLLDRQSGQCSNYKNRRKFVPGEGLPLPDWHYLLSGDRESVHRARESVRGWTVAEADAGDWENHLVDRDI